jgi:hypothetical protein
MEDFKIKILKFALILFLLKVALIFRYFIDKQEPLEIKDLEQIVEKELIEKHGRY